MRQHVTISFRQLLAAGHAACSSSSRWCSTQLTSRHPLHVLTLRELAFPCPTASAGSSGAWPCSTLCFLASFLYLPPSHAVINVSGHRIGTAEVESALVTHPKCAEAAVVGVEHPIKGQVHLLQ